MKKKWFALEKDQVKRTNNEVRDEDGETLVAIRDNKGEFDKTIYDTLKKRKLIQQDVLKYFKTTKGPNYQEVR